jgi:hypothetical protein
MGSRQSYRRLRQSNPYDKHWNGYFKQKANEPLAKRKNISKLAIAN